MCLVLRKPTWLLISIILNICLIFHSNLIIFNNKDNNISRFNVRGTNENGHVANFVETEQIIYLDNEVSSYIQTRGSVPLFWEQPGIQVGSHKIKISRGFEISAPAFNKHFNLLKQRYGHQVIINLLSVNFVSNKEDEAMLSTLFQSQHKESQHTDVPHVTFDYHQECRGGNMKNISKLKQKTINYIEQFSCFYAIGETVVQSQSGTLRTNCLDCLDRTNCIQTFFALQVLKQQLFFLKLSDKQQIVSRFDEVFRQMWINNGNEISKIYAGTGAIQGNSKLMDGARSAARTIQNNLLDSNKQEAIDILLLGSTFNTENADRARLLLSPNMLQTSSIVHREMCIRYKEYIDRKNIRVSIVTYNVNGGKQFRNVLYKDETLSNWLLDAPKTSSCISKEENKDYPVDIFAIGFEEIVDLNASNIMAASSENSRMWAQELQKNLSRDQKYILVTYQQLVGVCLYIFIRPIYAEFLKDVATDTVKTGLGGATGNKGAVAIRFVLFSTSFCFVCAHFSAGQTQVNERNADYAEITRKVVFPMGRTLNTHDYVFWCGDFNYRVDIDKDEMKYLISQNQFNELLKYDQLKIQQQHGNIFHNFLEGSINFPPTYKYDLYSNDYDTSEKCRQPAWTDRILWKCRQLSESECDADWISAKLMYYGRGELKISDHRPVIATLDIDIHCINQQKRNSIFYDVIKELGPPDGTVILYFDETNEVAENIFDDDFMTGIVQYLSKFGEIILVRFVSNSIWITFKDGKSALAATEKGVEKIYEHEFKLKLKSQDWISYIEKECDFFNDSRNVLDKSYKSCYYSQLHTSKSTPPIRPPQPEILKLENASSAECSSKYQNNSSLVTAQVHDEISQNISNISIPNKNDTDPLVVQNKNPPPLPHRKIPVSSVQTGLPPPVPARSSGGPPIPARNIR